MKGKNNVVANALSRKPYLCAMTDISVDWRVGTTIEYAKDSFANDVLEGKVVDDKYRMVEELILYKDWIYLVPHSRVKNRIIRACHDSPLAGHPGFYKTYKQGSTLLGRG